MLDKLPTSFQNNLKIQLGESFEDFIDALTQPAPTSVRRNLRKNYTFSSDLSSVAWCTSAVYLPTRPVFTLDPAFHAGAYYVQEASSMLMAQAIWQILDIHTPLIIMDLCAAPGGKTTLLADIFSNQSLIIANEVIKNRFELLQENVQKWGAPNVHTTRLDTEVLKNSLENAFDVILIDAPCSGEGLFRKDPAAIQEWSLANVQNCAARQKRIVGNAVNMLKTGGILIYSTCTYNDIENIDNCAWISKTFSLKSLRLDLDENWGVLEKNTADIYTYQCYPHRVKGEGFFMSVFQKQANHAHKITKKGHYEFKNWQKLPAKQLDKIKNYLQMPSDFDFYQKNHQQIVAVLKSQQHILKQFSQQLPVHYFGLELGTFKGDDFIPTHELALSNAIHPDLPAIELDQEQALHFLKKESPTLNLAYPPGWYLARYKGLNLGWMKIVQQRINNYLPKDFKIRMNLSHLQQKFYPC